MKQVLCILKFTNSGLQWGNYYSTRKQKAVND